MGPRVERSAEAVAVGLDVQDEALDGPSVGPRPAMQRIVEKISTYVIMRPTAGPTVAKLLATSFSSVESENGETTTVVTEDRPMLSSGPATGTVCQVSLVGLESRQAVVAINALMNKEDEKVVAEISPVAGVRSMATMVLVFTAVVFFSAVEEIDALLFAESGEAVIVILLAIGDVPVFQIGDGERGHSQDNDAIASYGIVFRHGCGPPTRIRSIFIRKRNAFGP